MTRPYGKIPRKAHQAQPAPSSEILIKVAGRHTLEQLSHELQIAVGRLQELGVHGVQMVRMRLETLDEKGSPIALYNDKGAQIPLIQIPEPKPEPPYRS